ncbi:protein NLP6-like isoform X2 [Actinidia eriantha]|uniref:protein NLP6-like isoform X2 n=1 Tax=Actinidia eriantha TaxID=165200 RepID=UPI002588AC7E|nr:protein NLP6-like isoform X2 [Actinidia eriantha]
MGSIIFQEMAEPEKYWTQHDFIDFKEYAHKELKWWRINFVGIKQDGNPIPDTDWDDMDGPYSWIFWSREHDDPDPLMTIPYDNLKVEDKVRRAIRKFVLHLDLIEALVQFWAATKTLDGRTLLTTQDQPFGLTLLSDHLCEYRMTSKDYKFYVDGEEDLGIPGRVYRNKCPEYTPNVEYYSVKEYPQRDRALLCGVGQSLHLPVIEQSSQICVGILEIAGEFSFWGTSDYHCDVFQSVGLECFDSCEHHETRKKNDDKAHQDAFNEIERVLKSVCKIHEIPLALTWVPCGACKTLLSVEDIYTAMDSDDETIINLYEYSVSRFRPPLRNGIGVVGRALTSPNLLYCSDVTQFSMAEYPLAHFAQNCKLKGCFAISLWSNYTGNDVYILEIFLPTSNRDEDYLTLLSKILETMKKEFNTFWLASGEKLGEKLSVEVIEFQNGQKRHYVQTLHVTGSLPSLEPLQNGGKIVQVNSSDHQSNDAEQCEIDGNHPQELGTKKTSGREHKKTGVSIEIPCEDIMKYSKLSRSNAAKNLQVSISTFKRVCRKYGISRWPPRNVDNVRAPWPSHMDRQEEVPQLNSNLPSNQASASIAHTQPHDTVIVKAKYVNGLTVLFPLSLSSTLEELYECIESRLHLSRATYHACYIDRDNDKITITCDQDLQFWLCNSPRLPGSNAVVLHIDPISQVYHSPVSYIDCFPVSLRPYIQHVKDVAFDGNCGFRAIAGLMDIGEDGWVQVRRDLLTELNLHGDDYKIMYGGQQRINELTHCLSWFDGCPGMDRWMTMPDMGHLIASCYNVVLYHLSHQQCLTFLPLRSVPIPAASRREIAIGFVNDNHFVEVFLLPNHPVPPVVSSWKRYRSPCAQGWDTTYNGRIQQFRELVGF